MPSDFVDRPQRKTLADLIRQLTAGPSSARPSFSTAPVAGPGRFRNNHQQRKNNRETEMERRRRLAQEALKGLRG